MSSGRNNAVKKGQEGRLTQAERTALSDTRMVETAIDLIVQHGIEGMTLKEVGEAAGYSRGLAGYRTLYYLPAIVPMVAASILWVW